MSTQKYKEHLRDVRRGIFIEMVDLTEKLVAGLNDRDEHWDELNREFERLSISLSQLNKEIAELETFPPEEGS